MDTSSGNFGTNMMDQTNNVGDSNGVSAQDGYTAGYDASAYATAASAGDSTDMQGAYGMNAVPDYGQNAGAVATSAGTATASATPVSPFAPVEIPDTDVMGATNQTDAAAGTFAIPSMPQTTQPAQASVQVAGAQSADVQATAAQAVEAEQKVADTNTAKTRTATDSMTTAASGAGAAKPTTERIEAKQPEGKKPAEQKVATPKTDEAKTDEQSKKANVLKNEIPKSAMETAAVAAKSATKKLEAKKEEKPAQATSATVPTAVSTSAPASGVTIEALLDECIRRNASDLHLQANLPPILRIDGGLYPITGYPVLDDAMVQQLVLSTLDADQKVILARDKEFDYSFAFGDLGRFRVNAFHEKGNMAAAFRLIPNVIKSIDDLGLPGVVNTFADHPNGLVLVTGPTGSGKSTTLAALVDKINSERAVHIITIEDPIEFTHQSKRAVVAQREVHYDTFSFAAALRSILREDPDVVLIGEMRDLETIQAAITVAETGHLVFATLHTNSAAQSIDRMIDVFPAHQQPQIRAQLANILVGICSQRLVPAIDGGRVAVTEILVTNSAVRSIIREGKTHQLDMTIQTGMSQGMQTMDRELAKYVKGGVISYDNAREFAVDVTEFDRLARG